MIFLIGNLSSGEYHQLTITNTNKFMILFFAAKSKTFRAAKQYISIRLFNHCFDQFEVERI